MARTTAWRLAELSSTLGARARVALDYRVGAAVAASGIGAALAGFARRARLRRPGMLFGVFRPAHRLNQGQLELRKDCPGAVWRPV